MTPMGYAWLVLKAEERTPTSLDWFNPFRMTRPHMVIALDQIHNELERRGGNRAIWGRNRPGADRESQERLEEARQASANNPFFRHTRAEMQQAMQMMSDELERRGRPPLSDEHFGVFSGGPRPPRLHEGTLTDEERMEYMRNFGRNRPPQYQYRRETSRAEPSPEQIRVRNMGDHLDESTFDRDELMSRLMSGDILTEKELKFLQNPPENDPNSAEYDPYDMSPYVQDRGEDE